MKTEKQAAIELEVCRERFADKIQADAYKSMAGMNELWEKYCNEYCLSDDDAEDAYTMFALEFSSGMSGPYTGMHKTVSGLAWRIAKAETDTEWLIGTFGSTQF